MEDSLISTGIGFILMLYIGSTAAFIQITSFIDSKNIPISVAEKSFQGLSWWFRTTITLFSLNSLSEKIEHWVERNYFFDAVTAIFATSTFLLLILVLIGESFQKNGASVAALILLLFSGVGFAFFTGTNLKRFKENCKRFK